LKGIGYFDHLLDALDRKKLLLEYFGFLGMPIVDAGAFISDYQVVLRDKNLQVTFHNDDIGCKPLGTTAEETVYISAWSDSEVELMRLQRKLEAKLRVVKLS
ncbi:hypothetical protein, partial [Cognatishimia sp.]|uniref:hypothetical protein n=1 Tax=Cognatishimia sp. TaxID=2211648 RepID=UPI003517E9C6